MLFRFPAPMPLTPHYAMPQSLSVHQAPHNVLLDAVHPVPLPPHVVTTCAAMSEKTPLLATGDTPALLSTPPGPKPESNSKFGFKAFFEDIRDPNNGTVPITILIAAVIGIACGFCAWVYYNLLEFFLKYVWKELPKKVFIPYVAESWHWTWIVIVGMSCSLLVGLSIKYLGEPGDLKYTVECVHNKAYVPEDHALPMVAASQSSIVGGGSLGPEAPLVAICASVAGVVSRYMFKQQYKNVIRKHTLCGMACALAAFFGVPLGGSLFALEINNRLGYEYFEHALAAIFSGTICLVVFRGLAGLDIGPIWEIVPRENMMSQSSSSMVATGALLGLIGAGIAALFAHFHWIVVGFLGKRGLLQKPVPLAILGGIGICTVGVLVPQSMFWGEFEFQAVSSLEKAEKLEHIWPTAGLTGLEITGFHTALLVGFAKLIAISFTVAGGYRGGFIFPFFCAGAAFGRAFVFLFPSASPVVACLSIAAGINVTITRTALATPLILCALAGEPNAMPPVLAASLSAAFITVYMVSLRASHMFCDSISPMF